jgi:hypothetical protein
MQHSALEVWRTKDPAVGLHGMKEVTKIRLSKCHLPVPFSSLLVFSFSFCVFVGRFGSEQRCWLCLFLGGNDEPRDRG